MNGRTSAWKGRLRSLVLLAAAAGVLGACSARSPFAGMSSEELYAHSVAAFEAEEWNDAIQGFERLLVAFPTFPQSPEARFMLARAHFEREEYLTAIAEFERFIQRHPGRAESRDAALGICRAYTELSPVPQRDQHYTRLAVTACQNVARDYAGTDQAQTAWELREVMLERLAEKLYLTGRFYYRRSLYDSGIIYFERVVEEFPETSWAPEALLYMVRSYENIGYEEEADEVRERLQTRYPDSVAARAVTESGS